MIADMINNKTFNPIITELFIKGRKLNISIVFITYIKVPKDVRLNSAHLFIMKISNKRELQQIAINHSLDINFIDSMKIYKKAMQSHILFCSMIQLYHLIIFEDFEKFL